MVSAVAFFGLMAVFMIPFHMAEPPSAPRTRPDCVLTGYSMADGDSLNGKKGVFELLGEEPACERFRAALRAIRRDLSLHPRFRLR